MTPEEIGLAYDKITHLWESPNFNRDNGIPQHQRALQFVKEPGRALDVGCGCTGRFIDLLLEAEYLPEGVDISAHKIQRAREHHPDIHFTHADICQWQPPAKYTFITAWDSIWHIPLAQQRPVLTKLVDALNPGGVLIFSFGGLDEPSEHTDDFMGPEVYYSTLGTRGFLQLFLELGCDIKHLAFDQHPEVHAFLIIQKPTV